MRKTFVMRGQTASGETETLNFSGYKPGYAYRLTEFRLWPSNVASGVVYELLGTITAGKTAVSPIDINFNDDGLIGNAMMQDNDNEHYPISESSLVNDTYIITQNLILMVQNTTGGQAFPINWQCRFESVKMSGPEEAAVNYKQFAISDE